MRALILVASFLIAGTATSETYEYAIADYPTAVATADDCRQVARGLAAQFASNAQVDSAIGICTDVSQSTYDIIVRYENETQIRPISTLRAGNTVSQRGFFASRESCEQALVDEQEVFAAATGLPALFAPYCVHEGGFNNATPWMFRIEAVGEPRQRPHLESTFVFGRIQGHDVASFLQATKDGLTDLGLNPRHAKLDWSLGMGYLVVYLYSDTNYRLESKEFAKLNSVEACNAELERFNAATDGTDTVLTYCAIQNPTARAEVAGIFLDQVPFRIVNALDQFSNYASCAAGRDGVVSSYQADGLDVADGLCSLDDAGHWRVILLTR